MATSNQTELPKWLEKALTPRGEASKVYKKWLKRKAAAHVKRDKKRGNPDANEADYKKAIHKAVIESQGLDAYTGEKLEWSKISQYNNVEAANDGRNYKKKFALLPTIDHVGDGKVSANFKICGWRTNDAKHDLDLSEFISVCKSVLKYNGYGITKRR